MKILGVCNATDSGAALIDNGSIVVAANEERFVRKKNISTFPERSIQYVLDYGQLSPRDIDWIGCGAWYGIDQTTTLPKLIEDVYLQAENEDANTAQEVMRRIFKSSSRDATLKAKLCAGLRTMGFSQDRVIFCDHHYSHALTAFYCSPFEEALVFIADGRGDFRSVTLWNANRVEGLRLLDQATELTSPGALYGLVTKLLGFIPDRHEGKVTGLAARGQMTEAYDILRSGFWYDEEKEQLRSQIGEHYRPFLSADLPELVQKLSRFRREDIAFAVQLLLERSLSAFLKKHLRLFEQNSVNLCLAGGCMGNVKLNFEFSKLSQVKNIYVFPSMGDGGNALGGAIHVARTKENRNHFALPTVYLGPAYKDEEIETELRANGLNFQRVSREEKIKMAVDFLAAGKVVGWFQGRMEYGPRSLGNRSILAEATNASINDNLNKRLERSEFMPFAPVTIPKYAEKSFEDWEPDQISSQFMTTCYRCTPYFKEKCPAVVHVDDTARPQVIFREKNEDYYDVVEGYILRTGNPALVNTSFNHHEEPIVNSPQDCIRSFMRGNIDVLIAGNIIILA